MRCCINRTVSISSDPFAFCYMTPLVEKGLVARTDPDKPMSPRQEYKLA